MAREAAGIEVFGRGVRTVEVSPREHGPRTPALGAGSVLLALLAVSALVAALIERERGSDLAELFTWIAMAGSAVAVVAGLFALLTGRGRLAGFLGALFGAAANPWVLSRVLEYAAGLPLS
jgi:hypothetical protein